jgi:hypothetical protein
VCRVTATCVCRVTATCGRYLRRKTRRARSSTPRTRYSHTRSTPSPAGSVRIQGTLQIFHFFSLLYCFVLLVLLIRIPAFIFVGESNLKWIDVKILQSFDTEHRKYHQNRSFLSLFVTYIDFFSQRTLVPF